VELVYKQRGLYRHYGMRHNGQVLHMSTDNILMAAVDQRVPIVLVDDDGTWVKEESVDITSARMAAIERSATMPQVFSADNNCETWAKDALGIKSITQARALLVFGLIMASVTGVMTAGQTGLTQKVIDGVKNAY
nr:2A3 [Potamipivirus A]